MNGVEGALSNAATWVGTGAGAGAGFFFVRWLAVFISGRWDKKEEQIDAATQQIITQLREENQRLAESEKQTRQEMGEMRKEFSERFNSLEEQLRHCERRHAEGEAEIMRMKATMQGYGEAREKAALIVAQEKRNGK